MPGEPLRQGVHELPEAGVVHGGHLKVQQAVDGELRPGPSILEQRNGEWRYLEFLQVTSLITAAIVMREIPGGTRAQASVPPRPVDLPEHRY